MSTLWNKGSLINQVVQQFTIGNDPTLDHALIGYDCLASIAHAYMLHTIKILSREEFEALQSVLLEIIGKVSIEKFFIKPEDEDVHTTIENYLVNALGNVGKKIHTGRSRNDQIAVDLRLYMRDQIIHITEIALDLCSTLYKMAEQYALVPVAGRTHFQKAMPSSMGLLFGAYLESMLDNIIGLQYAFKVLDQCPLGSASGFGINLPIDRKLVTDLLGFAKTQNNALYVANSRGKFESILMQGLVSIMLDLSKIATDIIIASAPEFGYITLPQEFCTGSSLMPQKKNPDVLELVRAKASTVAGCLEQTLGIIKALPSGYNRDFQETKKPLMQSITTTLDALVVTNIVLSNVTVNPENCIKSCTKEIFATDASINLVKHGTPFRDAYRQTAQEVENFTSFDPVDNIISKNHVGAPGNLGLMLSADTIKEYTCWTTEKSTKVEKAFYRLRNKL